MMAVDKCACMHGIACSCCGSMSSQRSSIIAADCGRSSRTVEQQLQRLQQRQLLLQQQQQLRRSGETRDVCDMRGSRQSLAELDLARRNSQPMNIIPNIGSVTKSLSFPINTEGVQISPTRSPGSSSPCSSLSGGAGGVPQGRLSSCSRSRQNTPDGGTLMSLVSRWRTDRSSRSLGGGDGISPRSGAGSPALSNHSSNSRESLNCDHVILGDRSDPQSMMYVRVYLEEERYYSFRIDSSTTVAEILDQTIEKSLANHDPSWSIVEHLHKTRLERSLEEHELVYNVYKTWPENSGNRFYLRTDLNKYELFHNPNQYFPETMTDVEVPKEDCSGLLTRPELYRNILLQNLLGEDRIPDIHGYMSMREGKRSWKKYFFLLTSSGLYYSPKGGTKDESCMSFLSDLSDINIYRVQHAKKYLSAPTNYGICLRTSDGGDQSSRHCKTFCCDSEQSRLSWVTAMRFIKYGAQLRENFKLMLKCDERLRNLENQMNGLLSENGLYAGEQEQKVGGDNDRFVMSRINSSASLALLNSDRYNNSHHGTSNGLSDSPPSHSVRLRVPCDPIVPAATDHSPSDVSVSRLHPQPIEPWFHRGLARNEAEMLIKQQGLSDGIFLLRDSQSMPGLTVLTFAHESQVKHCKIIKEIDCDGQSFYTLDGGLTRFMDLTQLVDFYQLNSGALPIRLYLYIANTS